MDTRQNDGTFHPRKTDDTVLMVDELTGSHKRGDMTALSARQVKVPNAHRAVAATNNGEQVCVQGAHGAHCRPPAEWAQPGRRRPVDNWRIRQPVASRTRHVTSPRDITPGSPNMVSKSAAKASVRPECARENRMIPWFYRRSDRATGSFAADLDTPTAPRPSARPEPHGRLFISVPVTGAHPDQDGAPHVTPPTCPPRGPSFFCRADPTSSDQVAGSCGRSRSDNLAS